MPADGAGRSFTSAEQVFTTYRAAWEQQLKAVQRGQYYGGSLLLVLPPDSALMSADFIGAYRADFDADTKRVYQLWFQESANTTLAALSKAGCFDSATLTRVVGYRKYAADFGYRYVLVYVGRPDGMHLVDMVTREEVVVKTTGEGLAGVMNGIEQALDGLGHPQRAVQRLGPDIGRQAVLGVIGRGDALLLGVEADDRGEQDGGAAAIGWQCGEGDEIGGFFAAFFQFEGDALFGRAILVC